MRTTNRRLTGRIENRSSHVIISPSVMMAARFAHDFELRRVEGGAERVRFPFTVNAEHVEASHRFDLRPHRKLRRMADVAQQAPERVVLEIDRRLGTEERDELDR